MVLRAGMTEGLQETGLVTWLPLGGGLDGLRVGDPCVSVPPGHRKTRQSLDGLSSLAGGSLWSLGLPRGLVDRAWPTTLQRSERALLS